MRKSLSLMLAGAFCWAGSAAAKNCRNAEGIIATAEQLKETSVLFYENLLEFDEESFMVKSDAHAFKKEVGFFAAIAREEASCQRLRYELRNVRRAFSSLRLILIFTNNPYRDQSIPDLWFDLKEGYLDLWYEVMHGRSRHDGDLPDEGDGSDYPGPGDEPDDSNYPGPGNERDPGDGNGDNGDDRWEGEPI